MNIPNRDTPNRGEIPTPKPRRVPNPNPATASDPNQATVQPSSQVQSWVPNPDRPWVPNRVLRADRSQVLLDVQSRGRRREAGSPVPATG